MLFFFLADSQGTEDDETTEVANDPPIQPETGNPFRQSKRPRLSDSPHQSNLLICVLLSFYFG